MVDVPEIQTGASKWREVRSWGSKEQGMPRDDRPYHLTASHALKEASCSKFLDQSESMMVPLSPVAPLAAAGAQGGNLTCCIMVTESDQGHSRKYRVYLSSKSNSSQNTLMFHILVTLTGTSMISEATRI